MTRWRYYIRCNDCTGVDDMGCFDGGIEYSDHSYPTEAAAEDAGWDAVGDVGPWEPVVVKDKDTYPESTPIEEAGE